MAASSENGARPALSDDERRSVAAAAHEALGKATTRKACAEVWAAFYLVLGHRVLGRLLLGQDVDAALRRKGDKQAAAAA